jgi:hypothetical protein
MKALLVVLLLAAPAAADTIAITNATIYQRADKKLDNATIVIRDGKITDVGTVAVPAGAKVIDGRGKVVTAGLVEASTQLGLIEVDLEDSGNDGRFGTHPIEVHAGYRASDAYDSQSVAIPVARAGGVTSAVVGPRGGLVAGQASFVSLSSTAVTPIKLSVAMHAALGPGASSMKSRGYSVERLRQLFDDVDAYRRNKAGFDRNQSRKLAAERLDLEALIPVLDGRQLLVIAAESDVDIRAALAIAAERARPSRSPRSASSRSRSPEAPNRGGSRRSSLRQGCPSCSIPSTTCRATSPPPTCATIARPCSRKPA